MESARVSETRGPGSTPGRNATPWYELTLAVLDSYHASALVVSTAAHVHGKDKVRVRPPTRARMALMAKRCADCGLMKSTDCFHIQRWQNGEPRLHAYCKECRRSRAIRDRQKKSDTCECGRSKYPTSLVCRACFYASMKLTGSASRAWKGGVTRTTRGYLVQADTVTGKKARKTCSIG